MTGTQIPAHQGFLLTPKSTKRQLSVSIATSKDPQADPPSPISQRKASRSLKGGASPRLLPHFILDLGLKGLT